MAIRDRGKIKWLPAHFMPEHRKLLSDHNVDYYRTQKPIIDENEIGEFENRICEAIEYNQAINLTVWKDGFTYEVCGFFITSNRFIRK